MIPGDRIQDTVARHQAAKRRVDAQLDRLRTQQLTRNRRVEPQEEEVTTTTTEFDNGDFVRVNPTPADGIDVGQIVAVGINYPEPVYVVNLGNVYDQRYERYYAGSDLTLVDRGGRLAAGEDGINTLHRSTVTEPEEYIDRANVPDPDYDPIGVGYLGEPA